MRSDIMREAVMACGASRLPHLYPKVTLASLGASLYRASTPNEATMEHISTIVARVMREIARGRAA